MPWKRAPNCATGPYAGERISFYHAARFHDGFSRSARRRPYLLHRRPDVAAHEGTLQITLAFEFDMPHGLAVAFQHAIRIGQRRAAREAEIHVLRVGGDVAEHVLHLSAVAEPDGDGVNLVNRFGGVG